MPLSRSRTGVNSSPIDVSSLEYLPSGIVDTDELIIIRNGQAYKNTAQNVKAYSNNESQNNPDPGVDPHANNVVLFIKPALVNNAWTIRDVSPIEKLITINGATIVGSQKSIFFDGNHSFLSINVQPDLVLGTNDFTLEYDIIFNNFPQDFFNSDTIYDGRPDATNGAYLISSVNTSTRKINFAAPTGGGDIAIESQSIVSIGTRYHIALSRINNVMYLAINGTVQASITNTTNILASGTIKIGGNAYRNSAPDLWLWANLFSFRITNGVGRYSQDFNPLTDTFLYS